MTDYEAGFLNKCAEYGLGADVSMALLEKEAFKVPKGKAVVDSVRKAGGKVRFTASRYWALLSGSDLKRAKGKLDRAVAEEASAKANVRKASRIQDRLNGELERATKKGLPRRKAYNNATAADRVFEQAAKRHRDTEDVLNTAKSIHRAVRDATYVTRGGTAAAGVAGTAGVAKAVSKGRGNKDGQEKKSEAYLRGFAEKCAEYGLDDSQSEKLLKRAYRIGPFRGVNGSVGDTGFSAGFGGGTVHAGIENPGRGGVAVGGHTSRELNHNTAAGAIAGALLGLIREKFRGEDEKKHYLRSVLLGSLLGGGAGGAYTLATSAPSVVDAVSGLLGKAKGKVDQVGDAIG